MLMDLKVPRALLVTEVLRVLLVQKENQVTLDHLDSPDFRVNVDPLDDKVQLVNVVLLVIGVSLVRMARMEILDLRVFRVCQVLLVPLVTRVRLAHLVLMALLVPQVQLAQEEIQAKMV